MIRQFLDLSTAHLSPATRDWLDEQGRAAAAHRLAGDPDCMIAMGSMPHGWFVHADAEACIDPLAYGTLLERRIVLEASLGNSPAQDGAVRDALLDVGRALSDLVTAPSADIPNDLWECFARANFEQCDYVMFDADAPVLDGLTTYDDDHVETSVVVLFPSGASI